MLIKSTYFTLIIFFFYNYAFATDLLIKGNERLSVEDIQTLTSIDLNNKNLTDLDIDILIKDLYASEQILDVNYTKLDETYTVQVSESPIIENIFINGNIIIKDDIFLELLNSNKNDFFNRNSISQDINLIKNLYLSKGYNSASISVSTEKFSNTKINLIFDINEGLISKVSFIDFIGNNSFNDSILETKIKSKQKHFYNFISSGSQINESLINSDVSSLINFYNKKGFENVKISFQLNKDFINTYNLIFYIEENERLSISKIDFKLSEAITSLKEFPGLIHQLESQLLDNDSFYDYFIVDDFLFESNTLISNYNINREIFYKILKIENTNIIEIFDEGINRPVIGNIDIYGNTITRSEVILSKIDISPGDYFSKNKLDRSVENLSSFKYINKVSYTTDEVDNKLNLKYELDENKKTGSILFGGSFTGDVGLGLVFSIKDYNLFGSGNQLISDISANKEVLLFDLNYLQYPLKNSNVYNSYSLKNKESDLKSSYGYKLDEKSIGYSLNFNINSSLKSSLGFLIKNSRGHSSENSEDLTITDNIGTFNDLALSLSISQNKTNNQLYPSSGFSNNINIKVSPKNISDNDYIIATYSGEIYYDFIDSGNYIFLSNNLGLAETLSNSRNKTQNTFSLGGLNFKGFDYRGIGKKTDNNKYIGGNKYFTTTIGYGSSFIFDQRDNIYVKFFYTIGSLWDNDYINQDFSLRSSIGTSFDILTPVGPVSFSYAIPIKKESYDLERKFNFTIGTAF